MLVDTHAHIYHKQFEGDLDGAVDRAREAGVQFVLQPAIDVASIGRALDLADRYKGFYAMAALHPSETRDARHVDFDAVKSAALDTRVVAIGESGLDYYWDLSFVDKQQESLRWHARLAMNADLPLVLHNRDKSGSEACAQDLVRILKEERAAHPEGGRLRGVFHCFGGPKWLADEALALGFYLGIGGTVTFKNGGVPEAIADVPLNRIILETDSPYLAPVPHRGKRNEPAYTRLVAERLAELRDMTLEEIASATTANARELFNLPAFNLSQ